LDRERLECLIHTDCDDVEEENLGTGKQFVLDADSPT
jgi:hypothetical protein